MRRLILLGTVFVLSAGTAAAVAPLTEVADARAVAMGGALRALARPVEAARMNPAAVARVRGFFVGGSYLTQNEGAFDAFGLTVVDNVSSPFGGAIQYLRFQGNQEQEDLSLSIGVGRRGQWWGGTLRYTHGRERGTADWRELVTGDFGALFERPNGLRIAAVAVNLIDSSESFLERQIAVGVAHDNLWGWAVEVDLVRNFEKDFDRGIDGHIGAEYPLGDTPWVLRVGQMWRGDTAMDYQSAGVGWETSRIQVGYGIQRTRQRSSEILHAFTAVGKF